VIGQFAIMFIKIQYILYVVRWSKTHLTETGAGTSEQAKIATLQEEFRIARSNARKLGILSFCFGVLMIVGFVTALFFPDFGQRIGAPILGILGAILFPVGAVGEWRANKTKMNLTKKLQEIYNNQQTSPKKKND